MKAENIKPTVHGKRELFVAGKKIAVHFNPSFGWHATLGNLNILNPYTEKFFSRYHSCKRVAKFFAERGFFPRMKPKKSRHLQRAVSCSHSSREQ